MQILFTILYILLFIVCLSVLIVIHELGHLLAAKAFKVYCFEYSIGFGPKLFSFKRKKGETQFSLRGIPFGGYVSMYGEGVEAPEGLNIPPERNLENIKKWKKGIILAAGVTMNAILAIFIFLISNLCFPTVEYYLNPVTVSETSIVKDKIQTGDIILTEEDEEGNPVFVDNRYVLSRTGLLTYNDESTLPNVAVLLGTAIQGQDKLDWSYFLTYVTLGEDGKTITKAVEPGEDVKNIAFQVQVQKDQEEPATSVTITLKSSLGEDEKYHFESPGISITRNSYYQGWSGVGNSFVDFGSSSTAIIRALGSLFVSQEARDQTGGIIAIGFETTSILQNFGFSYFLRVWGMISVNLAIVNLLPFPGLDGWQLLVLIVEGISKKKIPDKVKNIVSWVGIALLFGLMILLVVKDVFKYII